MHLVKIEVDFSMSRGRMKLNQRENIKILLNDFLNDCVYVQKPASSFVGDTSFEKHYSLTEREAIFSPLPIKQKQTAEMHYDFDSSSAPTKTWCPSRFGKLLQSALARLLLSLCLHGVWKRGGVHWKSGEPKRHHSLSIQQASVKVLTCFLPVAVSDWAPSFCSLT